MFIGIIRTGRETTGCTKLTDTFIGINIKVNEETICRCNVKFYKRSTSPPYYTTIIFEKKTSSDSLV